MINTPIKKSALVIITIVGIVGAFGVGVKIGQKEAYSVIFANGKGGILSATSTGEIDLAPFWKSMEVLNGKFVATTASSSVPTSQEKVYGAIAGLAASYGDPYTTFFPPEEAKAFEEDVRGNFEGIGMEIAIKDNVLTVVAPLKNTPAERAGMKPGDQILKIDSTFTNGMKVEDAVKIIRGPRGTTVTLLVKRNGDAKDIKVTRDVIDIPTIDTKMRDDGVFVISLYTFSANSANLFRDALREFILSGSNMLVLDLRGNPGGYLESAVDMASFFLPTGKTVVIEDSGTRAEQQVEKSRGYNVFNSNLKMVVLMNEGSASASEILAGALHEHGIAKLVGEKSFGKGSVQELIQITPDTSLKVTIAKWLTPNGHSISQNGLEPDVKVTISKKDVENKYDAQMEKAAEILRDPNYKL